MTEQVPLSHLELHSDMPGTQGQVRPTFHQGHAGYNQGYHSQHQQSVSLPLEQIRAITINVRVGKVVVRDKFEWDINNPDNSPEDFAECMCADLGLGSEFMLPIAHQIREKILEL